MKENPAQDERRREGALDRALRGDAQRGDAQQDGAHLDLLSSILALF